MPMLIPTARPDYFGKGSVEVAPPAAPNEGPTYRLAITCERLITQPATGVETVKDVLIYAAKTYGDRRAVGWRDVLKVHEEQKAVKKAVVGANGERKEIEEVKKWSFFELSDYKYMSFLEMEQAVKEVACALLDLGFGVGDVFNIYASTSLNWQLLAHACAWISTTIATAYDTLGESGLTYSLNEPDCIGVFTNADLLRTVLNVLPNAPTVRFVIYDGKLSSPDILDKLLALRPGKIRVIHLDQLRDLGRQRVALRAEEVERRKPKPDSLACIMYTSGSTGAPKGVCITHSNIVASIGSVSLVFGHHFKPGDTYLAYLPLAHVLEYIVELCALFVGVTSGYARAKTLTDASVRNCLGDLNALRPNIMFGVPTVWETIKKGIISKIDQGGALKKALFAAAIASKKNSDGSGILAGLLDKVVLSKVRAATGGQLFFTMNGGAPVSKETQEFLSLAVVPMMQGYGMTESCGMATLLPPELPQLGVVGLPVPSVEIKLIDVPNAGYLSTNNPPQGEVCIRGPSITRGYYKRPDLNEDEEVFTKDGWFRTGDVGQWNQDGTLSLIDRIKNLIKLQNGEYIALERLESIYKSCHLVANVCVHAVPDASRPIGIIVPHESNLRSTLAGLRQGHDHAAPLSTLCADTSVLEIVLEQCNVVGRRAGFKHVELLLAVVLSPEEWTPENGLVTPAQKIQRRKIADRFAEGINVSGLLEEKALIDPFPKTAYGIA